MGAHFVPQMFEMSHQAFGTERASPSLQWSELNPLCLTGWPE